MFKAFSLLYVNEKGGHIKHFIDGTSFILLLIKGPSNERMTPDKRKVLKFFNEGTDSELIGIQVKPRRPSPLHAHVAVWGRGGVSITYEVL